MNELTPQQVQALIQQGERLVLLDVREPEEVAVVRLPGSLHIPMGEVFLRLHELDRGAHIVVYCHHGIRSAAIAALLQEHGFEHVSNLAGGIDAWSQAVDPSLPRY